MNDGIIKTRVMDKTIKAKFDSYPQLAREKLLMIRSAIFELNTEDQVGEITETLKWGEPSYLAKHGSTVRLAWQAKHADHVSVFFNCNSILVETFKEIYPDTFQYVGNREIKLPISEPTSMPELMSCVSMSLRYHKIKHLPMLGA